MICLKCIFKALPSDLRNQGSIGHKLCAGEFHRLPAPHFSSVALEQLFWAMLGCDHPSLPWPFSPGPEHPPGWPWAATVESRQRGAVLSCRGERGHWISCIAFSRGLDIRDIVQQSMLSLIKIYFFIELTKFINTCVVCHCLYVFSTSTRAHELVPQFEGIFTLN